MYHVTSLDAARRLGFLIQSCFFCAEVERIGHYYCIIPRSHHSSLIRCSRLKIWSLST